MSYTGELEVFENIIQEMSLVYQHDKRPWMIGYSGGKDSTLLCCLVMEMLQRLPESKLNKMVYIVSSDTMVENPIVGNYMHKMSEMINNAGEALKIKADIVRPKTEDTFWSKVIGLGYPTPEAPGFRWCTERLKIHPMNKYTLDTIKNNGEVVLLLGVRKAESSYRANNIRSREIEGKLLVPHNDIANAYVYNPLTEIPNEIVWQFLLKGDAKSPWGSDNKYLFSLYQGENLGEEQSVVGEIDKEKIPVTGNSRFGCWCCTMVKEDKSLQNFIIHGSTELIPLREFRNWIVELRANPDARDWRRRNGSVYLNSDGEYGRGPFTLESRMEILRRLLTLQRDTGFELITIEELKVIDKMWEDEGDLSCRALVNIYYDVMGEKLPWDQYKHAKYDSDTVDRINSLCEKYDVPFDLVAKLLISVDNTKFYTRSSVSSREVEKIMNQGWLHFEKIQEGLDNEN